MKIGVLSDTHGEIRATSRALDALRRAGVDALIHCGDVGTEIVPLFQGLTVHFVPGNVDDPEALREAIAEPAHTLHEPLGILETDGRRIAFLHGDDTKLLRHLIYSGSWDLVCHGHTHAFAKSQEGRTAVLNPGAISRTSEPSVAIVDLPSMEIRQLPLG
jgi:putative phosphoesterase